MLNLPGEAIAHLQRQSRRLTVCGVIYKRDGSTVRCTQHDEDIDIDTGDLDGVYLAINAVSASDIKSASDLSVDNLEIAGIINDDLSFAGFTVADIESGQFDGAPFETFICQWDDPSAWQKIMRRGYVGEISRNSEGQFTAEWRGMMQAFQQGIGRTYSELCDVKRFGDTRCGLNVEAISQTVGITSVVSRRKFFAPVTAPSDTYFDLGEVRWLSGLNAGRIGQIKRSAADGPLGNIELWESAPYDIAPGDQAQFIPGCDRRFATCQEFSNQARFRGDGFWIPGQPSIIRAP